ncbi:MAG: YkvA family protein [Chloroflexota bacterium]
MSRLNWWRQQARQLKKQTYTLYFAYRDPRTPILAKVFTACVVAYAFSPIDLIPDFIPVLGYLDDLIIVPIGIAIALKLIPGEVIADSQQRAVELMAQNRPINWIAAAVIVMVWILLAMLCVMLIIKTLQK